MKQLNFSLEGEHWQIKELGDMYGDREVFNEKLSELNDFEDFNKESEYLLVTITRIPK